MHLQGETWQAVIKGHELDPMSQQQDQQRLLLERFQREVRALEWRNWCVWQCSCCTPTDAALVVPGLPPVFPCPVCLPAVQHPGFDFSGATVNGEAPDAATFMGGISADAKLD